jgi:glycosyltransferase involved in cell wall biosynthesis
MKIVHISSYFYPRIGGVERVVFELARQLAFLGHNVTVLSTDKKSSVENISGVKIVKTKPLIEVFGDPISFSLFNFLRLSRPEVVHVHSSKLIIPDVSVIICYLLGLPCIITLHVNNQTSFSKRILSFFYDISIRKLVFKLVDRITVSSKINLEDTFIQKYRGKISIIPHGINLKPQNKKSKHEKFRILFVGKLDRKLYFKGLKYLIRAMSELSENIELIVIGKGELKKNYKILAKTLGLESRIKFLGYVKEDELYKWYSKVDCLVLPSISMQESFGLVALEAMSMGVPVIVTNVCGISTIVEKSNSGIVIEPEKPGMIASAVEKLYDDQKFKGELGRNAFRTAKDYKWEIIAEKYLDAYKTVLKEKSRGGNIN